MLSIFKIKELKYRYIQRLDSKLQKLFFAFFFSFFFVVTWQAEDKSIHFKIFKTEMTPEMLVKSNKNLPILV